MYILRLNIKLGTSTGSGLYTAVMPLFFFLILFCFFFRVGQSTSSQFVPVVCGEIVTVLKDFIKVIKTIYFEIFY